MKLAALGNNGKGAFASYPNPDIAQRGLPRQINGMEAKNPLAPSGKTRVRRAGKPRPNRIAEWRDRRGLTQQQLADKLGCNKMTVVKLESGALRFGQQWHRPIADALNVPVVDLFPIEYLSNPSGIREVPVISWASAGAPMAALQEEIDETTETVATSYKSESLLAVRVSGSSMNRVAPEGTFAVYDYADKALLDGKYYLFRLDGDVTFKVYRDQAGPPRLEPDSFESHATIFPATAIEVIGRVVEIIRKL